MKVYISDHDLLKIKSVSTNNDELSLIYVWNKPHVGRPVELAISHKNTRVTPLTVRLKHFLGAIIKACKEF